MRSQGNCKRIRIPGSEKFLLVKSGIRKIFLVESEILGFGARNIGQVIQTSVMIGIRNPLAKNLDYSTWNPESTVWNPESNWISWIPLHRANSCPHGASSYPHGASSYSLGHHTTKESCERDGRFPVWVDEW